MSTQNGWFCQFMEEDLKTSLPRRFTFQDAAKVMEMAMRGGAAKMSEDKQAIEYALKVGRGSVWLNLTGEQYGKLTERR